MCFRLAVFVIIQFTHVLHRLIILLKLLFNRYVQAYNSENQKSTKISQSSIHLSLSFFGY